MIYIADCNECMIEAPQLQPLFLTNLLANTALSQLQPFDSLREAIMEFREPEIRKISGKRGVFSFILTFPKFIFVKY